MHRAEHSAGWLRHMAPADSHRRSLSLQSECVQAHELRWGCRIPAMHPKLDAASHLIQALRS